MSDIKDIRGRHLVSPDGRREVIHFTLANSIEADYFTDGLYTAHESYRLDKEGNVEGTAKLFLKEPDAVEFD